MYKDNLTEEEIKKDSRIFDSLEKIINTDDNSAFCAFSSAFVGALENWDRNDDNFMRLYNITKRLTTISSNAAIEKREYSSRKADEGVIDVKTLRSDDTYNRLGNRNNNAHSLLESVEDVFFRDISLDNQMKLKERLDKEVAFEYIENPVYSFDDSVGDNSKSK